MDLISPAKFLWVNMITNFKQTTVGNYKVNRMLIKQEKCYTPIAFDERVTFWLNVPGHCLACVRLLHCMRVRLRNGYTRAYAQIMQHTYTHKAVTGRVEVKKLLSRRRQSNYREQSCTTRMSVKCTRKLYECIYIKRLSSSLPVKKLLHINYKQSFFSVCKWWIPIICNIM